MCGIVGQLGPWDDWDESWFREAIVSLRHRGPDDEGRWIDAEVPVRLGHRRLSVVDLSDGGHQPYTSTDGRWVVVFNGEIYNHRLIRSDLEQIGHRFLSSSDTEVLVAAIQEWGLKRALERVNGMFAIGAWDRQDRVIGLARDRIGEKPLFVQRKGLACRFASELKALRAGGSPAPSIDRTSLALYMRLGYVPAPHSIYEGVSKVQPGTIMWVDGNRDRVERFWEVPELGYGRPGNDDELHGILADSVALRMRADVPVGAFLSGGIDSSLVAATMVEFGGAVRTFTIGFEDPRFDESAHAAQVARHLGTDHTELTVTSSEALAVVPTLPVLFDEPFADQSAIPTALVASLAGGNVTVVLSGDGGDELFGGYTRFRRLRLGAPVTLMPAPVARVAARTAGQIRRRWSSAAGPARTLERVAWGLEYGGTRGLYQSLVSLWEDPSLIVRGAGPADAPFGDPERWPMSRDLVRTAMGADLVTYLPDDILTKVDRTTMAVGLEARVPLLDHRVIEWARCNARPTVRDEREMKAPLRRLLARHLPIEMFERPKMGFGAPIGEWLRGPLRPWADDLLDRDVLAEGGLLVPEAVLARWMEHRNGILDWSFPLWAVLCFQAWKKEWM